MWISSVNANQQKLVSEHSSCIMENGLHMQAHTLKSVRSTFAPFWSSHQPPALLRHWNTPMFSPPSPPQQIREIPGCVKRSLGKQNLQQELCTRIYQKVNTAHCRIRELLLSQDCWDTWQDRRAASLSPQRRLPCCRFVMQFIELNWAHKFSVMTKKLENSPRMRAVYPCW